MSVRVEKSSNSYFIQNTSNYGTSAKAITSLILQNADGLHVLQTISDTSSHYEVIVGFQESDIVVFRIGNINGGNTYHLAIYRKTSAEQAYTDYTQFGAFSTFYLHTAHYVYVKVFGINEKFYALSVSSSAYYGITYPGGQSCPAIGLLYDDSNLIGMTACQSFARSPSSTWLIVLDDLSYIANVSFTPFDLLNKNEGLTDGVTYAYPIEIYNSNLSVRFNIAKYLGWYLLCPRSDINGFYNVGSGVQTNYIKNYAINAPVGTVLPVVTAGGTKNFCFVFDGYWIMLDD